MIVTNTAELQAAAIESRERDLEIIVKGRIACPWGLDLGKAGLTTTLTGGSLYFGGQSSRWREGVADPPGIRMRSSRCIVQGVGLQAYNGSSGAIRFDTPPDAAIAIEGCTFVQVGRVVLGRNPRGETGRTQCVTCHAMPACFAGTRNVFLGCCVNEDSLSHCWYINGRTVWLSGNTYRWCGNPWGDWGLSRSIIGETVLDPAMCWDEQSQRRVLPFLLCVHRSQPVLRFTGNVIKGKVRWLAWGCMPRGTFTGNDYSGLEAEAMAWDYDNARAVSIDEWHAAGLDAA